MRKYHKKNVPGRWQPLLWSADVKQLDLAKDKYYIINQVLAYGTLRDIRILFQLYSRSTIRNVFLHAPQRVYTAPVFDFVRNYVVNLGGRRVAQKNYVQTLS